MVNINRFLNHPKLGAMIVLIFLWHSNVFASPVTFDWGSFDATGSSDFGVFDEENSTSLVSGDIVQLIWVGPDGVINVPIADGTPGGDDYLLDISMVTNSELLPPPMKNKGYITLKTFSFDTEQTPHEGSVYMRAWNAPDVMLATAYGDSELSILTSGGMFNTPRWYTNTSLSDDKIIWIGPDKGDWEDPDNWSSGIAPSVDSNVIISDGHVFLSNDTAVNNLTISPDASLDLGSHNLTVEETLTNNGALQQTKIIDNGNETLLRITNSSETETKLEGIKLDTTDNLEKITITIQEVDGLNGNCPSPETEWLFLENECIRLHTSKGGQASVIQNGATSSEQLQIQSFDGSWQIVGNSADQEGDTLPPSDSSNESKNLDSLIQMNSVLLIIVVIFMFAIIIFVLYRRQLNKNK